MIKFLIDEDLTRRIQSAVWHQNPGIDILRVGDEGAPPYGTSDVEVLIFAEQTARLLVTEDKHTLLGVKGHLAAHFAQGRRTWGVAFVRPYASLSAITNTIVLLAEASRIDEWRDREMWIPFE